VTTATTATTALDAVFTPRRVALVGASDRPGSLGALLWRNLSTFDGEVLAVTPSADRVGDRTAVPRLGDIDGPVDLAVLAVPAAAVPDVARDAADAGVRALLVLAGGFAEAGPQGAALQDDLATTARAAGMRVVGPNCFGVHHAATGLNASIAASAATRPGGIALITQSGAYGMALLAMAGDEQVGIGTVYASGNKVDIGDHEVVDHLRRDPATTIICLFAESVADGRALAGAVRASTPTTPVVIARTGRSAAGARAASSHTGALAGDDVVFRAAMRQAGGIVTRSGLEMLDVARALDGQPLPAGRRAAIVTNSGGTGVELADLLADEGVEVPELSAGLQAHLAERLPPYASARNPVDITPVWSRFAELYPWVLDTLARSGEIDVVIPVLLQRAAMDAATVAGVRDAVTGLRADDVTVPVHVCWVAPRDARANADILQQAGVPCFEWPDRTARAVGQVVRHATRRAPVARPGAARDPDAPAPLPRGPVPATAARALLERRGIATVATALCTTADEAVAAAERLGHPVVLKAADPALAHRSDVGGVRTGLRDAGAVADAYADLADLGPQVLVQAQLRGIEVAVGAVRDDCFGPVVMVGAGGTAVEVLDDVAFALAPVHDDEVAALLDGLRIAALLDGHRGAPAADRGALHAVVRRAGDLLVADPRIRELDLNPVLVRPDGAVAVDWKLTTNEATDGRRQ
jgi:acyl-CoA synthetase (NDP forming)